MRHTERTEVRSFGNGAGEFSYHRKPSSSFLFPDQRRRMPLYSRWSKRSSKGASIESPNHFNSTKNVMETGWLDDGVADNNKVRKGKR